MNRKIKAVVGIWFDLLFDAFDGLKTTLTYFRAKHDVLESQASAVASKAISIPSVDEPRRCAIERFWTRRRIWMQTNPTLKDIQLV